LLVLARMMQQVFHPVSDWKPNNRELAITTIAEDIKRAKHRILLYGGLGEKCSDQRILDAIREKNDYIQIKMIFQNEHIDRSALADLAKKKKNFYLGSLKTNPGLRHFRVIDYDYVYIEKTHPPNVEDRSFKQIPGARFLPAKYAKLFSEIERTSKEQQK